jgi:hypothetical protein
MRVPRIRSIGDRYIEQTDTYCRTYSQTDSSSSSDSCTSSKYTSGSPGSLHGHWGVRVLLGSGVGWGGLRVATVGRGGATTIVDHLIVELHAIFYAILINIYPPPAVLLSVYSSS